MAMLGLAALFLAATYAVAEDVPQQDVTLRSVALRPGVEADIHVSVFVNPRPGCKGEALLAVPGVAHTAATWGPFASAIFESGSPGREVCQVAAVDFPGHGASSLPRGVRFCKLRIGDYVTVLDAVLERLPQLGMRPRTIVAHSQGGLVVQLAQQSLLARGASLRGKFQVERVVLFASVGPAEIPWDFVESGRAAALVGRFVRADRERGPFVAFPDPAWPGVFFSDLSERVVPGAPAPPDVAGYNAPSPLTLSLEVAGFGPLRRPHVDAGVFGPGAGTTLRVVAYEQDTIIRPDESLMLYEHLTGDAAGSGFDEVMGAEAVHDMHLLEPGRLLEYLGAAGILELP